MFIHQASLPTSIHCCLTLDTLPRELFACALNLVAAGIYLMLKPEGPRARTVSRTPTERPEWRGPPSKSYDLQPRTQQDHCLPAGTGTGRLSKLTLSTLPPISCQHSPLAECTQKPEWEGDHWLASWSQSNGEGWKMDLGKQEKTPSMLTKWSTSCSFGTCTSDTLLHLWSFSSYWKIKVFSHDCPCLNPC